MCVCVCVCVGGGGGGGAEGLKSSRIMYIQRSIHKHNATITEDFLFRGRGGGGKIVCED